MKHTKGISLLEVLIALFVLAVGIVALVKFQSFFTRQSTLTKQEAVGLSLTQKKIETLRHFETLTAEPGKFAYDDITSGNETINGATTNYTIQWTVTEVPDPAYKLIDAVTSWTNIEGNNRSMRLSSIIGRMDPAASGQLHIKNSGGTLIP